MKTSKQVLVMAALFVASPALWAAGEKDCLLKGTIHRDDQAGEQATMVKIHSVEKYAEDTPCKVRGTRKMEFKLPQDTRLQQAPDGSEVRYRYRSDGSGESEAELISVGA